MIQKSCHRSFYQFLGTIILTSVDTDYMCKENLCGRPVASELMRYDAHIRLTAGLFPHVHLRSLGRCRKEKGAP